jgi:hypothetical protein
MTESQFSAKLLRALRQRMPNAIIWKLNDRFTSGIPDAVVVYEGRATWLEMKIGTNSVTPIQWETLYKLKRGYVVSWNNPIRMGTVGWITFSWHAHCYVDACASCPFNYLVDYLERLCKSS